MHYPYSEIEREFKNRKINRTITTLINIEEILKDPLRWDDEPNYIYMYLDTRCKIPKYKFVDEIYLEYPIIYIGRGTGSRVLHKSKPQGKSQEELQQWISFMKQQKKDPSIIIFADGMDIQPAKQLEADLIRRALYLQSVDTGLDIYKSFLSPNKLINKRQERSCSMFYNIYGEIMLWLELLLI